MSKAYVIKNKEGKYFVGEDFYLNSFSCAKLFTKYEIKKVFEEIEMPKDCTIVPITIYEGDPLKLACEETDNYWNEQKALEKKMTLYDYFIQQAKESERDE